MATTFMDTLLTVDRLLAEAVTHASHAAVTEDRAHGRAEAARAVNACRNARQLVIYLEELMEDEKRKSAV